QHDLTHCTPTPADIHCFARLRFELTEIFANEAERRAALIDILQEENIIPPDADLNPSAVCPYTTDEDLRTTALGCYGDFLYFLKVIRNEICTGNAEPYMEAIHYWWAHVRDQIEKQKPEVRDRLNYPAILLVHPGSHFSVAVAAFTDVMNVETLATIPLHVHSTNVSEVLAGERFIYALRTTLQRLHDFYGAANNLPPRQIEYPFRNYIVQNEAKLAFEYIRQVPDKRVFHASLEDGTPLFVKFSRRYGEVTHHAAHDAGLAPRLLSVENVHGWYVVAMEDLSKDYVTLAEISDDSYFSLLPEVHEAVCKLHALGHVHGDIRPINILVKKPDVEPAKPRIVFVDWDWSGESGKVCYPHSMNPEIKRSESAFAGAEIKPSHDLDMVSFCYNRDQLVL
ncbi:hypothetical protein F5890DRAFT_1402218, partial [Lentinula detonsa]